MKKIYVITIFTLCLIVRGEAQKKVLIADSTDSPFTRVEVEAAFPGGAKEWIKYLQKNLNPNVPASNNARKGRYMVIVRFIVSKDGSISDVVAETNHGYGMENEVKRVIQTGPKWTPAMQNGNIVKAYRRQPITFWVK
jgi:periplasmic protein TonB